MAGSGNFDVDYIKNQQQRVNSELADVTARINARRKAEAEQQAQATTGDTTGGQPAPAAAQPAAQPSPAPAAGASDTADAQPADRGYVKDIAISALDGVVDAGRNALSIIPNDEWKDFLAKHMDVQKQAQTIPGELAHGATQFATGFIPAVRAAKWAGLGAMAASTAAGAVSSFFTYDPHEARLSNLATEVGWGLDNPLTRALRANPDDGAVEGRVKNALENAGLGAMSEGVIKAARWVYGAKSARSLLTAAADEGKIPVQAAADASDASSRLTMLRQQLQDLQIAKHQVWQLDQKATDELLAAHAAGAQLTPEQASRIEAAQFRAGQSGEDLATAAKAQGAGETSALEELAKTDPELSKKISAMVGDGGSFATAEEQLTKDISQAEQDYLTHLQSLPRDTAEELAKKVDDYTTEATLERDANISGQAKSIIDGKPPVEVPPAAGAAAAEEDLVAKTLFPGIKLTQMQVSRLLGAIKDGTDLNVALSDGMQVVRDNTNFMRMTTSKAIEDHISSLAAVVGGKRNSFRMLGVRELGTTKEMGAELWAREVQETGSSEAALKSMYANIMPGIKDIDAKLTALRIFEQTQALTVETLGKQITNGLGTPQTMAQFVHELNILANVNDFRSGVSSQLGRGLSAGRIDVAATDLKVMQQQIEDLITNNGGEAAVKKAAAWWANGGSKFTAEQRRPHMLKFSRGQKIRNAFVEYWINSILSGPITQVVNTLSNHAMELYLPAEHLLGGLAQGNLKAVPEALHSYIGIIEGYRATLNLVDTFAHAKEGFGQIAKGDLRGGLESFGKAATAGTFGKTLATGELQTVGDFARQFDMQGGQAISAEAFGLKTGIAARMVDAMGTVINLPTRSLSAFDELAKGVNYHMSLSRNAYKAAAERGLSGEAAGQFRKLIHNNAQLWHAMGAAEEASLAGKLGIKVDEVRGFLKSFDDTASSYAREATFTEALATGSISRSMQKMVNSHPMLRFVSPFIRTPMNILKFMTERMPTQAIPGLNQVIHPGAAGKAVRAALAAGGQARQAAISRIIVGSGLWTTAAVAAYQGHITGRGPSNTQERDNLMATGWRPYSAVFVNDDGSKTYVAINRLDPFGGFLSLAADYAQILGDADQTEMDSVATDLVLATSQMMLSKSYFVGLSGALSAVSNPDRSGRSFAQRFIGSWVPSLLDQTQFAGLGADENDTSGRAIRDAVMNPDIKVGDGHGMGSGAATFAMQSLDYMRQTIANRAHIGEGPPRRNVFGDVVAYPPGWGPDIASPFFTMTEDASPIGKKMRELSARGEGVRVDMRSSFASIGSGDLAIHLNAEQQDELIKIATGGQAFGGRDMRTALNHLVEQPNFNRLDVGGQGFGEGGQVNQIEKLIHSRIAKAKELFARKHPEVQKERRARKTGASMARRGYSQEDIDKVMNSIRIR